jgi:iron complex transport system substrate-binding protein
MTRRGLGVAVLCAAVAALVGSCARHDERAAATTTEARRIVSLAPSTTEALFAVGAGDRVVGRSRYCDWPPEATALPSVGGLEPDLEAVLLLRPDLVVGPLEASSSRLSEQLSARGIATWFPLTESLASIDALLLGLGERTGHPGDARRVVAGLAERERAVEQAAAAQPRVRVLMVVDVAPVIAAGPGSFVNELLARAGAANAVAGGPAWPTLGFEQVLEMDPDVILDASVGQGAATQITPQAHGWGSLRAVREGRVVPMHDPRVLRPGPRIAEGLAALARMVHPGAAIP